MNIDYSWKLKDELDHKSGDDYLNTISGNDRFFMVNNRIHVA